MPLPVPDGLPVLLGKFGFFPPPPFPLPPPPPLPPFAMIVGKFMFYLHSVKEDQDAKSSTSASS